MEIIVSLLVCFLAVYGVFKLLCAIAAFFLNEKCIKAEFMHDLIAIDDNSENIENYIRAKEIKEDGRDLIILDHSTNEEMKKLLAIFENNFCFVKVMSESEYIDYITNKL